MRTSFVVVLIMALVISLTACSDDDVGATDTPTSSPTATLTDIPTAPTSPTPIVMTPTSSPQHSTFGRVVFLRSVDTSLGYGQATGEIWITDIDSRNETRLTPDGVRGWFAGVQGSGEKETFYYVTLDTETDRTLWAVGRSGRDAAIVLSYQSRRSEYGVALVHPSRMYVVHGDSFGGLYLYDVASGVSRLLVDGAWGTCQLGAGGCYHYDPVSWSPDGETLLIEKGYYEGGEIAIMNPFTDPVTFVMPPRTQQFPSSGEWSSNDSALCGWGTYGGPSPLYLTRAPDWRITTHLTDSPEGGTPPYTERWITGCTWLSATEVAVYINATDYEINGTLPPNRRAELQVFDVTSESVRTVWEISADYSGSVRALGDGRHVVLGFYPPTRPLPQRAPPETRIVDVSTGASEPILSAGDRVVALVD